MGKGIELLCNLFLALAGVAFFGGNLYLWIYPLKGHPWREKVLREFFIWLVVIAILSLLWYVIRKMEEPKQLADALILLALFLALWLTTWASFLIWGYSSGWVFLSPIIVYIQMLRKGIRPSRSEMWDKMEEIIKRNRELASRKSWRVFRRILPVIEILVPIAIFLCIFLRVAPFLSITSKPIVISARISEDDEFLALDVFSPKNQDFLIINIPSRQVILRFPFEEKEGNRLLGWFKGSLLAFKNYADPHSLLIWRKENGTFRPHTQLLPPGRYEYLYLKGYPPTLYATLKGSSQVVKLEEKEGKFFEEATFSFPSQIGYDPSLRWYLWSWEGKPLYVILKTDGSAVPRVGLLTPGGKMNWLGYLGKKGEGIRLSWNFFDGGNKFYFLFQREKGEPTHLLPYFILVEISPQKANIKEFVWEVGESDYIYKVIATKKGFVVIYPFYSVLNKGKRYLFIISPKGDRSVLEFKGKGFSSATSLNEGNKFLLFAPGEAFLLDGDKGELEKFMSFKELLRSQGKNAGN